MHQKLPAQAAMIFNWDFTGKQPKAVLVALDFNANTLSEQQIEHAFKKEVDKVTKVNI